VNCSDFLKELTDYLDGVIDADTKAELDEHLAWCHNCFVICNTTKKTIEIYRGSELYELPDDLRS
jgi:anti-sigma factor RsiW